MSHANLQNLELNPNISYVLNSSVFISASVFFQNKWTGSKQNWVCIFFTPNQFIGRELKCQNVPWTKFKPNYFIWLESLMTRESYLSMFNFISFLSGATSMRISCYFLETLATIPSHYQTCHSEFQAVLSKGLTHMGTQRDTWLDNQRPACAWKPR